MVLLRIKRSSRDKVGLKIFNDLIWHLFERAFYADSTSEY